MEKELTELQKKEKLYRMTIVKILKIAEREFKEDIMRIALKDYSSSIISKNGELSIDEAILLACSCCDNINPELLYTTSRKGEVVVARWLSIWYISTYLHKSLSFSAGVFGKKHDHAIYGNDKINEGDKNTLGSKYFEWISNFKNAIN